MRRFATTCFALLISALLVVPSTPLLASADCGNRQHSRVNHLLHKSQQLLTTRNIEAAVRLLEQFTTKHPGVTDYRLHARLAELYSQQNQRKKARDAYHHALQDCDEPAWLWQNYGAVCWNLGDYAQAAEAFLNAHQRGADRQCYVDGLVALSYAGQHDKAAHKLFQLLRDHADAPITWLEAYVQISLQSQDKTQALQPLITWEVRFQGNPAYWRCRTYLHLEDRDYPGAISCLRVTKTLTPLSREEQSTLADLLLSADLPEQAAHHYRQLLEAVPDKRQWHKQLILCYRLMHQPQQAQTALQAAQPFVSAIYWHRTQGELSYQLGDYTNAFHHLEELLRRQPDDGAACLLQSYCALQLNRYRTARTCLNKALQFKQYRQEARSLLNWINAIKES
ncbi:lipopolysaccharide assembly protein LapB [Desulfuromonas acetoxidans]|uniref:Tetratricopeptide TPR_2 n=1 Tax=Desulfuromonas acetoxidans (strain DSM 684 / 11070) TaxID=281689 RepID=Q1JX33_DESA6|nr:tetratricopeptide repeat protein [Desulfuromonas acetoxidans]EAT14829.1 Tetratricopeptide TPR_2 [Desulfuromonas acetoxidans DSM 684]MBF0646577.1 tetratricopeptide repeat protein [Desulfuromonas acetoxidans]NVD26099.1 tetratricopeptide repeat protein [Desulfuromonas acetoxidans]NVE17917.1 tetratricopeptide repeat protein [Desulfuromonas acetoxidans]